MIYTLLDMREEALSLLEETEGRVFYWDYGTLYKVLLNDPFCKKLQEEPRFKKVVEYQKQTFLIGPCPTTGKQMI